MEIIDFWKVLLCIYTNTHTHTHTHIHIQTVLYKFYVLLTVHLDISV